MDHPKFHYTPPATTTKAMPGGRLWRERKVLPHLAEPGPFDVVCGKGKHVVEHSGNQWLKQLARQHVKSYASSQDKAVKSKIISNIVDIVRSAGKHGGFIAKDKKTGQWWEVGDHVAHEKVGFVYKSNSRERYLKREASKSANREEDENNGVADAADRPATGSASSPMAAVAALTEDRDRCDDHPSRPNGARLAFRGG